MEFREGLLWIKVAVQQTNRPLNFLVDTGAEVTTINLATAQRLRLKLGSKAVVQGVHYRAEGFWPTEVAAQLSGVQLPARMLAVDLNRLSQSCKCHVDGLLGADFFRKRVVQINYAEPVLRLLDAVPSDVEDSSISLDTRRSGFRVPLRVNNGKSQWVRLDTGCSSALEWVTSAVRSNAVTTKLAVGLAELPIPQTMTGVRLGDFHLDTVPTGLHRRAIFPGESGLLGNGLLAGFGVITLDTKAGRLFLGLR